MENLFQSGALTTYGENWTVKSRRTFTNEEVACVRSATVVDSKYGKSVCFFLARGGSQFIPLSNQGVDLPIGASVPMDKAELLVLGRTGDSDIMRVEIKG